MVKLYGVVHGGHITTPFLESKPVPVMPSNEFISSLKSLPKGTKVGLEWFNEQDVAGLHISTDFKFNCEDIGYWGMIANACKQAGHQIIFLENPELYKKYEKATIEYYKQYNKKIYFLKGESNNHYHVKLCRHNERHHKANVLRRYIHEIERDDKLLEAIKLTNVDVAVVGVAHSDYWTANKEKIKKELGVVFEGYSTDIPIREDFVMHFTEDNAPDPKLVYSRDGLERELRIIKQGRIIADRTPDYVGLWELVCTPSHGYFEMFVEQNKNGKISGTIEDCLGTAVFEGELTPTEFNFVKKYDDNFSLRDAFHEDIIYKSECIGNEFIGYYSTDKSFWTGFFMKQSPQEDPVKLSARWDILTSKEKKIMEALKKRIQS